MDVTIVDIERMAFGAIERLPEMFQAGARGVVLRVEDWPSEALLDELDIDDALDLTGLYDGIPLPEKSVFDQPSGPDTILLFVQPILQEWRDRGDIELEDLVAHVVVHEFAHHFGWSDEDIAQIDRWWE